MVCADHPLPLALFGVVGDRRSAAVVGADGAVQWFCLPHFDGMPVFGSLLDAEQGGYWTLGPAQPAIGQQSYAEHTNVLSTRWTSPEGELELTDAMLVGEGGEPDGGPRLLRRLRCVRGEFGCAMRAAPRAYFAAGPAISEQQDLFRLRLGGLILLLWTSRPIKPSGEEISAAFRLAAGEEFWAVLSLGEDLPQRDVAAAEAALQRTLRHWREAAQRFSYRGPRRERVLRSALAIDLLSFEPTGAIAAAATTSLPEKVGGKLNYDYRYSWIRDASMAIATLSVVGDVDKAERYLGWVAGLESATEMPLQVLYRVDGGKEVEERTREDLAGYRGSRPVRFGNHAFRQRQIDALGYLADSAIIYLLRGGRWRPEYWHVIRRIAVYTVKNWRKPSNGIWEHDERRHFVASKVLSWVALKRSLEIAELTDAPGEFGSWRQQMDEIRAEVMELGWSAELGAFREQYGRESLDASALMVPLMGFLEPRHPRVLATVARIEQLLMADGLVYRYRSKRRLGGAVRGGFPEGAFLPCCAWLAATYALLGRERDAEAMLDRMEALTGGSALFSEEADPRSGELLGNIPMVFTHAEYARAVLQLAGAWPSDI